MEQYVDNSDTSGYIYGGLEIVGEDSLTLCTRGYCRKTKSRSVRLKEGTKGL